MVSHHVQALEDRLGARLLNRTTRKVNLTEIGKAYYERAVQILADLEEADSLAGALQGAPRGVLRLYTGAYIARFLAPVISEYLALYPNVSVDLTVGEGMVDLVEQGFDLVIRPLPPPDSSLIVRKLAPWRNILCCAPEYLSRHGAPAALEDLTRHNCLRYAFYPFGDEWRFEAPDGGLASVRISGNLVTNSADTLRKLTLDGRGLFLAPSFVVDDDLRAGRLVRVLESYRPIEFAINAIYPHRRLVSAKVRSFLDLLGERFAAHRRWLDPDAPDDA
jgi:DNA-binding transcriptional LysR family regulator